MHIYMTHAGAAADLLLLPGYMSGVRCQVSGVMYHVCQVSCMSTMMHGSEVEISYPLRGQHALLGFFPCKLGGDAPLMLAVAVANGADGPSNLCTAARGNYLSGIDEHGFAAKPICGDICGIRQ